MIWFQINSPGMGAQLKRLVKDLERRIPIRSEIVEDTEEGIIVALAEAANFLAVVAGTLDGSAGEGMAGPRDGNLDKAPIVNLQGSQDPTPQAPDEPIPPDAFRWKGKSCAPLANGPYRALAALWDADHRCISKDDLPAILYDDAESDLPDNTLPSLRGELNEFFRKHSIALHAVAKNKQLAIKDGAPPIKHKASPKKRPAKNSKKS